MCSYTAGFFIGKYINMTRNSKFRMIWTVLYLLSYSFAVNAQSRFEDMIGERTYQTVERTMGFYEHEALLSFVKETGKKLEQQIPGNTYEFKYYLVDTDVPNAFATAGGYVFVTRGLLAVIDTEDELAGVLGHEFTHVLHHHSTESMYRKIIPLILEIPGNLVSALFSDVVGNLMNLPIELTAGTVDAAFSRRQENDADSYGIELTTLAGYDPSGLESALLKLETYVEMRYNSPEHFTLFRDHPLTAKRAEHLEKLMKRHHYQKKEETPLLDHQDGLLIGQNPENGVILADHSFLHPGLDLALQFPPDWIVQNTPAAVTSTDSSGRSGFLIGIETNYNDLDTAVAEMSRGLQKSYAMVEVTDTYDLNGFHAASIVVSGTNVQENGITLITYIELPESNGLLHCIGTAHSEEEFLKIEKITTSVHPLAEEEKTRITYQVMNVVQGGDETFEEFVSGYGPEVMENMELMQMLNRMDPSENVQGKPIKIIRTIPYYEK